MTQKVNSKINEAPKLLSCFAPIITRLKEIRLDRGISQFDLECKIGLARGYLSKWECGDRTPSLFNFLCWAKALDLEIEFLPIDQICANDNGELIANDNVIDKVNYPKKNQSIALMP